MAFNGATAKFSIGSLDDVEMAVDAQYNPKEVQFDRPSQWVEHKAVNRQNTPTQEFTGTASETVKIELLFDGAENNGRVHANLGAEHTVAARIAMLKRLASVREPLHRKDATKRRPHYCVASWGNGKTGIPRFECVIESISIKYMMFADDGTALRATATISLKSAERGLDINATEKASRLGLIDAGILARQRELAAANAQGTSRPVPPIQAQRATDRAEANRRAADAVTQLEAGNAAERAEASRKLREQSAKDRRSAMVVDDLE